jgi:hypothetical protein
MNPVNGELFNRTAPRWNCVDFPGDGMHYVPGTDTCAWCGMTTEDIKTELRLLSDATPMKESELGKYVCVIDGGCLHSPHITITSDGIWRKRPNPAGPSPYVYTSAHRDCYVRRILLKET